MSALVDFIVEIGSAVAVALWVSAHLLKAVLVPAVEKIKTSADLRFVVRYGLVGVLSILAVGVTVAWLAYEIATSENNQPRGNSPSGASMPTISTSPKTGDEYPHDSAKLPAGSGVTNQSNGS